MGTVLQWGSLGQTWRVRRSARIGGRRRRDGDAECAGGSGVRAARRGGWTWMGTGTGTNGGAAAPQSACFSPGCERRGWNRDETLHRQGHSALGRNAPPLASSDVRNGGVENGDARGGGGVETSCSGSLLTAP